MSELTHGELFAGIGGFSAGFARAGIATSWAVEIDPQCRRVLAHHHPDALIRDDVREVTGANLPYVDIITGGFPCQDVSVAGKRAGLAGERTGLLWEAVRIVAELRPAILVLENVPGLLSSNRGRDFGVVLDALADLGALDIAWRICDAQYFGVAQRRRRVFVVADFRGERASEILALAEGMLGHPAPRREARKDVAGTVTPGAHPGSYNGQDAYNGNLIPAVAFTRDVAHAVTCHQAKGGDPTTDNYAVAFTCKDYGADAGSIAPTLRAMSHDTSHANGGGQVAVSTHMAVRRLTPTECLRLQAFPDDHLDIDPMLSDSAKYRMVGNSVCVNVVAWLAARIVSAGNGGS